MSVTVQKDVNNFVCAVIDHGSYSMPVVPNGMTFLTPALSYDQARVYAGLYHDPVSGNFFQDAQKTKPAPVPPLVNVPVLNNAQQVGP